MSIARSSPRDLYGPFFLVRAAAQIAAMILFGVLAVAPPFANAQQNDPEPFTFVVVGDTQTDGGGNSINWDVLPQMIQDMNTHNPAFGLFVGDLVGGSYSLATTRA